MKILFANSGMIRLNRVASFTKKASSGRQSFSFGTTPENVIKSKVQEQTPSGYPMQIKSQSEWKAIAAAVNKGIDSHLEGFTRANGKAYGL